MKHKYLFPILALLPFILVGCSAYYVISSDKDNNTDFEKYKTFAWLPDKDNSDKILNNQIMRNNIKNYFTNEFVDHYGLTANTKNPDVLIELQVTVFEKVLKDSHPVTNTVPIYTYGFPYPYNAYPSNHYSHHDYYSPQPNPYNYNGYYIGYRYQTTYINDQHPYTESNITINMIDCKQNELVWTITAQTDIYENESKNVKNDIHRAVKKMLKYFPVNK